MLLLSVSTILTRVQEKDRMSLPVKKRDKATLGILYNSAARSKGPSSSEGPAPEGRRGKWDRKERKKESKYTAAFSLFLSRSAILGDFSQESAFPPPPPSYSTALNLVSNSLESRLPPPSTKPPSSSSALATQASILSSFSLLSVSQTFFCLFCSFGLCGVG